MIDKITRLFINCPIGLPLSKLLQNPKIDLKVAVILANDTKQELQDLRKNAEKIFKDRTLSILLGQVKILAESFDIEIKLPRL